jgi:DNA-binding NtrC family response regulator
MERAIICVDDERSILAALQLQMMREYADDFLLEFAESGEEALDLCEDFKTRNIPIALVLTDEMMPGIKGHELVSKLAELSPNTICIMLTGYADSEIINSMTATNLACCLAKPWDNEELFKAVTLALKRQ